MVKRVVRSQSKRRADHNLKEGSKRRGSQSKRRAEITI